jgi:hypothetical protein
MGERGEYVSNRAIICNIVKQHLLDTGKYEQYQENFLNYKLGGNFWAYNYVLPEHKNRAKQNILDTMDDDEIAFIKEEKIT